MEKFGWKFTLLPCPNGFLEEKTLKDALNPKVRLVCLMKVNNVTGSILDIENYVKISVFYHEIDLKESFHNSFSTSLLDTHKYYYEDYISSTCRT